MARRARAGRSTHVHAPSTRPEDPSLATVPGVNADDLVPGCFPCDQQAAISLPPREDVVHTDHWRVAHAFNSTLPGWLVLLPTRHVASFTEPDPGGSRRARWARTSPWHRTRGFRPRWDEPYPLSSPGPGVPPPPPPLLPPHPPPPRPARTCLLPPHDSTSRPWPPPRRNPNQPPPPPGNPCLRVSANPPSQ